MIDIDSTALDFASVRAALSRGIEPAALVAESCRRVAESRAGAFTATVPPDVAVGRAREAERRARDGADVPLLGMTFSVKDNIHVAGMATTSNCTGLSIMPRESAAVVLALERAGAVLVGKNTMDQFATGLSGTRGPEPLCRNAVDPAYIPGGSSSGSAVAVAASLVTFALGSDTGGSGRVPAACNGIVGVKPTIGLVSGRGLLYNSRFLDCIPVFARTCADANEILRTIAGYDPLDPTSRRDLDASAVRLADPASTRIAVPRRDQLDFDGDRLAREAHARNLEGLRALGFSTVEIDFAPFEEAGRLVFQSALVSERLIDGWDLVTDRADTVHPIVRAAIEPGLSYTAKEAFEAIAAMMRFRRQAADALASFAALAVPTIPTIPTVADMLAAPLERNTLMGRYTYFVNVMDLCAVAVPGVPRADGLPSSLCFVGPAGSDGIMASLAARFEAEALQRVSGVGG